MFYFWNVNQLVKDLRAEVVTEFEKMRYLLFAAVLQVFAVNQASNSRPINPNEVLIKALFVGLMVGIVVWGIYYCFKINQRNDNKNFLERFVCLSVPIGVRLGVYFLLGMLVILILGIMLGIHYYPVAMQAIKDFSAHNVTIIKDSTQTIIKTSGALQPALVRMQIFQYIYSLLFTLLFFIFLGKKIDEVSRID